MSAWSTVVVECERVWMRGTTANDRKVDESRERVRETEEKPENWQQTGHKSQWQNASRRALSPRFSWLASCIV